MPTSASIMLPEVVTPNATLRVRKGRVGDANKNENKLVCGGCFSATRGSGGVVAATGVAVAAAAATQDEYVRSCDNRKAVPKGGADLHGAGWVGECQPQSVKTVGVRQTS